MQKGNVAMLKIINNESHSHQSFLDEIARKGAVRLLAEAMDREVAEYVDDNADERDELGHRLVTRNGKAKSRTVVLGAGQLEIEAPRVNDRRPGHKFTSMILPPYLRKSPNVESLLPVLYLRGLSTNDFQEALTAILGEGVRGLSPASIVALKRSWEREFDEWKLRKITERFVYIWADGVNVKVRLGEDKKICLLVVTGTNGKWGKTAFSG